MYLFADECARNEEDVREDDACDEMEHILVFIHDGPFYGLL